MILKLISTPEDVLVERFKVLWPEGTSQELQMILALKGTKRNDQQVLIDLWGLSASSSSAAAVTAAAAAANKMMHKTTSMLHPTHANALSNGIAEGHSSSSYDMNISHNNMMNSKIVKV